MFIDESHQTMPQVARDVPRRSIAQREPGRIRIPSAVRDGQPSVQFRRVREARQIRSIYVSATPGPYELTKTGGVVVEQVIRPTGLIDPEVEVRPVKARSTTCCTKSACAPKRTNACW